MPRSMGVDAVMRKTCEITAAHQEESRQKMNMKLSGLNGLIFAGVALALAACSTTDTVDESSTTEAAGAQNAGQSGTPQPGAVRSGDVEGESLDADRAGAATQASLEAFAGTDRVFFAFDSSELSPAARRTLQRQADWMKQHSRADVVIEGHADERGTREYNLALGDRRATAVKNYLVALGISPQRVETISYGKERPAVLGSGEEVWRQNRRAVMKVQRSGA